MQLKLLKRIPCADTANKSSGIFGGKSIWFHCHRQGRRRLWGFCFYSNDHYTYSVPPLHCWSWCCCYYVLVLSPSPQYHLPFINKIAHWHTHVCSLFCKDYCDASRERHRATTFPSVEFWRSLGVNHFFVRTGIFFHKCFEGIRWWWSWVLNKPLIGRKK